MLKFELTDAMPVSRLCLFALVLLAPAARAGSEDRPDFSGVWTAGGTGPPEVYIVDHAGSQLRIVMFIEDSLGARTLDVSGPVDGEPHAQTVNGSPCIFRARWEGRALFWETSGSTADGLLQNRRTMTLSEDGTSITAVRTRVSPPPEQTVEERWKKQDPPRVEPRSRTCFDAREFLEGLGAKANGPARRYVRGGLALIFDDLDRAERELQPALHPDGPEPASKPESKLRVALSEAYKRSGQIRKALALCEPGDCGFLRALSQYPEMSVIHRGRARGSIVLEHDGSVMLPVLAAGKDSAYTVDTGSSMSLLSASEVNRLGIEIQPLTMPITDLGGAVTEAHLAIVPVLSIGEFQLANVPFWVMEDKLLGAPGILGINVLLAFRTLRWDWGGTFELGFAPQRRNLRKANVCFEGAVPVAEVAFGGQSGLGFVLDTGNAVTNLSPPFAARFLSPVAQTGQQASFEMAGYVGRSSLRELIVPNLKLRTGGLDVSLDQAHVLLQKPPLWNVADYGCLGIDFLNRAQSVTLDFQAMRITLKGPARASEAPRSVQ